MESAFLEIGVSGTTTSEKSSWPTALIVNESGRATEKRRNSLGLAKVSPGISPIG